MLHASALYTPLLAAALAAGNPALAPRGVAKLDAAAFQRAQQRDDAATRALANVQIKAADGRCLFVDALSGDARANLTPLQIADCAAAAAAAAAGGRGFDVITSGKHVDRQGGAALVVSTLTQACLSFDPRRPADGQVHLFSCGGRADGGGRVADSQLFAFVGGQVTVALTPRNGPGRCLVAAGDRVVVAECDDGDAAQQFTFGGDAGEGGNATESTRLVQGAAPTVNRTTLPISTVAANGTTLNATAVGPSSTSEPINKPVNITAPATLPSPAPRNDTCSQGIVTVVNTVTVTVTMLPMMGPGVAYGSLKPTRVSLTGVLPSGGFATGTSTTGKKAPKINKNLSSKSIAAFNTTVSCDQGGSVLPTSDAASKTTRCNQDGSSSALLTSRRRTKTAGTTIPCDQGGSRDALLPTSSRINATVTRYPNGRHTANPTAAVPVSRAGATLDVTAAAAANPFDATAERALESVNLRVADGRCLVVDPTAGDSRQNLIPVGLASCTEDAGQKFDVVTRGRHDDGEEAGRALLVSVLTNGCLTFDGRRQQGDTVTMFSCGGRADGEGQTATSQLFPFDGSNNSTIVLQPASDGGKFCLVAGKDRLESTSCDNQKDQVVGLVEILQSTIDKLL